MGRATVHPLTKFYKWKYSGLVVVPGSVILILTWWFLATGQAEFFEYWSCDTIKDYMMNIDVPEHITPHDQLTEKQHLHLHKLLDECNTFERYSEPFEHTP